MRDFITRYEMPAIATRIRVRANPYSGFPPAPMSALYFGSTIKSSVPSLSAMVFHTPEMPPVTLPVNILLSPYLRPNMEVNI